jgi:hypothetical protein
MHEFPIDPLEFLLETNDEIALERLILLRLCFLVLLVDFGWTVPGRF